MKLSSQAINSFHCVCSLGWLVQKVKLKPLEHYKGPIVNNYGIAFHLAQTLPEFSRDL